MPKFDIKASRRKIEQGYWFIFWYSVFIIVAHQFNMGEEFSWIIDKILWLGVIFQCFHLLILESWTRTLDRIQELESRLKLINEIINAKKDSDDMKNL